MTVRPSIATHMPTTVENADVTVVGGAGHVGIPLVITKKAWTRSKLAGCPSSNTAQRSF